MSSSESGEWRPARTVLRPTLRLSSRIGTALGKAEYCNNAAVGTDRQKAEDCAFQALVRDKGVSPNSCLRDAIANSQQGSADLDEFVRKWRIASGADCGSGAIAAFFPEWHGALGKAEFCNNVTIGADREKAKNCAFQALVDKGVSPNSCLRDAIANSQQGRADLDEFVRKWRIAAGADCSADSIAAFSPYWHGALGREEYCNNAAIGPNREKAKDCAFQALVRDRGVPANSCLRDAIANSPQGSADLDEFVRKWQAATGGDCSAAAVAAFSPYWHGALGKEDYCNNAAVGPDREEAKECAFQALVRDKGVSPNSCLRDAIANSQQGSADLDEFVRKWNVLKGKLPQGTVAAQEASVNPPEEACDPAQALDLDHHYFPPKAMLDWSPTRPYNFNLKFDFNFNVLTGVDPSLPGQLIFDIPEHFTNSFGANEARLRVELRNAAHRADPLFSLCESAKNFAAGNTELGNALADLSVTGRRSFARFRQSPPNERNLQCPIAPQAVTTALDRAYRVANALRFGASPDERLALGWIAVSGEDDQPHRPVNVPAAEFPQYDLTVKVPRRGYNGQPPPPITVSTRYMIAYPGRLATRPPAGKRQVPDDPQPTLPADADVIVYVHGMDSRLEEALDLTHALHAIAQQRGKKYTIISMDLPTSGYADNIDHLQISPLETMGVARFRPSGNHDVEITNAQIFDAGLRNNVPLVDFIEDFIVAFLETLDSQVPVKQHLRAIVGGSLGGNIAMRLGRRTDKPWIKAVVPWSPAAIWPSFAAGNNPADHIAVAVPWLWAGGDPRIVPETDVMRRAFFYYGFDWRMGLVGAISNQKPQAEEWYRDSWTCKAAHIFAARLDRYETYDPKFRLWHWRLGAEQLVFSQQLVAPDTNQPLYMQNSKPMLLVCGYDDTGGKLCWHTRNVAWKMTNTPGKAFFLHNTGHSIHNERPKWLAGAIADFLEGR
jgi:pimeloyl-ACP methyl ester carboxylesterase